MHETGCDIYTVIGVHISHWVLVGVFVTVYINIGACIEYWYIDMNGFVCRVLVHVNGLHSHVL